MKKLFVLAILPLFLLSVVSAVCSRPTHVAGIVYQNADIDDVVAGASVNVTCNSYSRNTTSLSDGTYDAEFTCIECATGDTAYVSATSGSLYGSNSGIVHDFGLTVRIAVVPVPLVPEFGIFIGALTILSAVGVFFVIRKK